MKYLLYICIIKLKDMILTLNKITERITLVIEQLRATDWRDAIPHYEYDLANSLEVQLALYIAGFKACSDVVLFETNHVVNTEIELPIPEPWERFFTEEEDEHQEFLRLKAKFEKK